ncbi:MAG: DNA polymerase III subunit beta [Candidatus Spechtbacterales bacterium]
MNVLIRKEILVKGLQALERVVGRNTTLPIVSNILVQADAGTLTLLATDLEMALKVVIPTKVQQGGAAAVAPRLLSGFLGGATEDIAELSTNNRALHVAVGSRTTTIKGEDAKDFPLMPKVSGQNILHIPARKLVQGLALVVNAAATSDVKPELAGVLMWVTSREIRFVATDSFRLAERAVSQQSTLSSETKAIIPLRAAQEMVRAFQETEGDVEVTFEESQLAARDMEAVGARVHFVTKIVDGDFPDYTQIIPKTFVTTTTVDKNDLAQQVRTAGLFASKINDVRVAVGEDQVTVSAQDTDTGEFQASLAASTNGEAVEAVFNVRYLADGLQNIEGDEVQINVSKKDGPVLLRSPKQSGYFYLLMPIRSS